MYKKLTTTYDFNRKQEKAEKEFPFRLGKTETRIDGFWENLTINQAIDLSCRVYGLPLEKIELFKGNEEFKVDYSKPYNEVLVLLNTNISCYHIFIEKIDNEVINDNGEKAINTEYRKLNVKIYID